MKFVLTTRMMKFGNVLRWMPFLRQLSLFIRAWDWHRSHCAETPMASYCQPGEMCPLMCCLVSALGVKSTPNAVAPSVMSSKGKTVGASAPGIPSPRDDDPEPSSEEDDGLKTDGPDTGSTIDPPSLKFTNAAFIFTVQGGGKPTIYSPSASDLKDILDILTNPKDNPIDFVKTIIQTTRNAQLCGADYKFILMSKMGPMYDEDELVAKVVILDPKHDTPEVVQLTDVDIPPKQEAEGGQPPARRKKGTKTTQVRFIWRGADHAATLITLKDSLTTYRLGKQEGRRDLTQSSVLQIIPSYPDSALNISRYPLSEDKACGIDKILSALLDQGVVVPVHSSYNTPVNPVPKPNVVHSSLQDLILPEGAVVLQYADDLFISAETADICKEATWSLLNRLAQQGFKVSLSKLQFCKTEVKYLGFILTQGTRCLSPECVELIYRSHKPMNKHAIMAFLGLINY
ncbi:hypothetical protein QTP86_012196 [Hemibagrus guttatus]|nr:hypothetical protein QTP86_012196 [Hemibagrus guttatus]